MNLQKIMLKKLENKIQSEAVLIAFDVNKSAKYLSQTQKNLKDF